MINILTDDFRLTRPFCHFDMSYVKMREPVRSKNKFCQAENDEICHFVR